jgi:hypothetical protein
LIITLIHPTDLDNAAYTYLLPAADRAMMQRVGRPAIGERERLTLLRTKWLFMLGVPLSAPLST